MRHFADYHAARAYAESKAREYGCAYGIEFSKFDKQWVAKSLPRPGKRFGHELMMETVEAPARMVR